MRSDSTFHRHRPLAFALAVALGLSAAPLCAAPAYADDLEFCREGYGKEIEDPLPGRPSYGLSISLTDLVRMPETRPTKLDPPSRPSLAPGKARINYIGEIPGDSRRRLFVPDLNGKLYLVENKKATEYLDVASRFSNFQLAPGLGSGFGFVAFHPAFQSNRKFYTVHTEAGKALYQHTPTLPVLTLVTQQHAVITEWTADSASAGTFSGSSRQVLRVGHYANKHSIQQIGFNPYAKPGSADYGLLYLAYGDGQEDDYLRPEWVNVAQDLTRPHGKILRIDPLASGTSPYTVPKSNPYVTTKGALGEIYAIGLRDPHRFSWDPDTGKMYLGSYGERKVESVYEVKPKDNYGWNYREGIYAFQGKKIDEDHVYALPKDDKKCGFTYPVATYGRDVNKGLEEGNVVGIAGGFVYRGNAIPYLRGKYVFTDMVSGFVFYADVKEMKRGEPGVVPKQAPLKLLRIWYGGKETTMSELATGEKLKRSDVRFGIDSAGELYLLAKANGMIWKVGKK